MAFIPSQAINTERMEEEEKQSKTDSNGESIGHQKLDFLSSSQRDASIKDRDSGLKLHTFGDTNFQKEMKDITAEKCIVPSYLRNRHNLSDHEEQKERISQSIGSNDSF